MKILEDIAVLLAAACQAGANGFLAGLARTIRQTCLIAWLVAAALALLLGAVGLMIAALFLALTPHMGAHWAALIAAAAALVGSGLFAAIAAGVSKMKPGRG